MIVNDQSVRLDYPYPIRNISDNSAAAYFRLWHNFIRITQNENRSTQGVKNISTQTVDSILDTKYNAVRTDRGLRFKSGSDRLMFVLRFS